MNVHAAARSAVQAVMAASTNPLEQMRLLDEFVDALPEDEQDGQYDDWYPAFADAYQAEGAVFPLPMAEGQVEDYSMCSLAGGLEVHTVVEEEFARFESENRRLTSTDVEWVYEQAREHVTDRMVADTEVRLAVTDVAEDRVRAFNRARKAAKKVG